MRKYTSFILPMVCGLFLMSACKMPDLGSTTPAPPPPKVVKTPEVVPVKQNQSPDDVKLVTSALIERLRGGHIQVENVAFDPAGQHSVGELGFSYDGFDVQNVAITGYVTTLLEAGRAQAMLEGIILFKDIINRRAGIYFATQYMVTPAGVNITKSVVAGIPPDFPRVETFFVSEKKFKAVASSLTSYVDYYLFAIENAEPMTYGEDGKKTGLNAKYFIMSFCKDRLFQESSLEMRVTSRPYGGGKKLADAVSINDSGWRILIAGGKFVPGSSINKFYVGVNYQVDPDGYLPAVTVGEFWNVKDDVNAVQANSVPTPVASTVSTETTAPVAEGPLALGKAFLNPVFPEDVKIIQVRLKELGLYTYKIDQNFGPLTRKALDIFAEQNGLPKGQWSIGVQKALFKGTGL